MSKWLLCALACCAPAAEAVDTLIVGSSALEGARNWVQVAETTRFVGVAEDSIWTWEAKRGVNLAAGLEARGGFVGVLMQVPTTFGYEPGVVRRESLSLWADGDQTTAWGPDDDDEIERRGTFFIDLGATFRVDRIRFFPRLDSEHSGLIMGAFAVGTSPGDGIGLPLFVDYKTAPGLSFSFFTPNRQPVVDVEFARREVRYIRLASREGEPWELAEFEVYAEGSVPLGEYTSVPLFIRGGFPIWGRVQYEGGEVSELPVTIQTRSGPDDEPLHYFLSRGDELERVSQRDYLSFNTLDFAGAAQVELGPVRPNPEWSPWQTVADGLVLSPAPRRYIQFRVLMAEPGTVIGNLLFEYVEQPLVNDLVAEISPLVVDAGVETEFVLSMEVHLNIGRGDTGFRYVQVRTPALVERVEQVLVDDEEVVFTPAYDHEGFVIDIWERIIQSGSFVQVVFRATVLRDGTAFEVRALDLRPVEGGIESVYQTARPGDVDPLSVAGELVVRLRQEDLGLVDALRVERPVFTPNGDGINDVFEVAYNLLKLTRPAPVLFEIFDLGGRLIARGVSEDRHGRFVRLWRGVGPGGGRVAPGLYIYRIKVEADVGKASRQGVVQVVY
jgi:hypothetical protein